MDGASRCFGLIQSSADDPALGRYEPGVFGRDDGSGGPSSRCCRSSSRKRSKSWCALSRSRSRVPRPRGAVVTYDPPPMSLYFAPAGRAGVGGVRAFARRLEVVVESGAGPVPIRLLLGATAHQPYRPAHRGVLLIIPFSLWVGMGVRDLGVVARRLRVPAALAGITWVVGHQRNGCGCLLRCRDSLQAPRQGQQGSQKPWGRRSIRSPGRRRSGLRATTVSCRGLDCARRTRASRALMGSAACCRRASSMGCVSDKGRAAAFG